MSRANTPETPAHLTAEAVASLPPPGLSGPSQISFAPGSSRYLAYVCVQQTQRQKATVSSPRPTHASSFAPLTTATHEKNKKSKRSPGNGSTNTERVLMCLDLEHPESSQPLLRWNASSQKSLDEAASHESLTLEERLRRERQRFSTGGSSLTHFSWVWRRRDGRPRQPSDKDNSDLILRLLVPARGSLYIQDGILDQGTSAARCIHDKSLPGVGPAIDPQLSPDGCLVAWSCDGEIFVKSSDQAAESPVVQLTFGAQHTDDVCISHGVADFVSQEEIDRYRGFWWHPDSTGILFTRTDESSVPIFRIMHADGVDVENGKQKSEFSTKSTAFEDHRYPFAGKENPKLKLGYIDIDRSSLLQDFGESRDEEYNMSYVGPQEIASEHWERCTWLDPPREAPEYLARVNWLPDGTACAQWQNRSQNVTVLSRIDLSRGKGRTLLLERSDVWINLHHMFEVLERPVHPRECHGGVVPDVPPMPYPLPQGSFSFLFASEMTGYSHVYLYTFVPGINGEQAIRIRALTAGKWVVEHIVGVDINKDIIYITGTFDSPLERHLYAVPLRGRQSEHDNTCLEMEIETTLTEESNGVRRGFSKVIHAFKTNRNNQHGEDSCTIGSNSPVRLTNDGGMHNIVMDESCSFIVDTSSDLSRPTSVRIFEVPQTIAFQQQGKSRIGTRLLLTLYDAMRDDKSLADLLRSNTLSSASTKQAKLFPPPELISFPTSDGTETLHAALYRPDPLRHGGGPYPLVCAVYGGPHVQRVNRSWSQSADLRAQRLRNIGFCVVKCDNRGSSRRGLAFESAVAKRLGRLEVLDQVAVVRQLVVRGLADSTRVGIYGWSYGGYLAAMCLFRAPDVFQAAVAGAPVTSWDGYDTHYTERYMGLPSENPAGYRESAVFDHVPNMVGNLMIVHGLIDENVHFRHAARLINKLIASMKEYDLLIFPEERHSPRRLRDRIYMETRITNYFVRHLGLNANATALDLLTSLGPSGLRTMAGHL